jgi:hypothetical protein
MRQAAGRGWLVYSTKKRSLRAGPTYVASTRNTVRVRQPDDIGRRVADAVRRSATSTTTSRVSKSSPPISEMHVYNESFAEKRMC